MSSSLKKRTFLTLWLAVTNFIAFCVIYKLLLFREDWLSYSIMWSISWAIGYFVANSIHTLEENLLVNFFVDVLIIVVAFFVEAFIIGVLIELPSWKEIIIKTMAPFGISLIIYTCVALIRE